MKLIYVTNARIPTEKAHGLQIMKSCEAFAFKDIDTKLIVPSRTNTPAEDPFDYYSIKKKFPIKKLFCVDLFEFPFLPKRIAFHIQSLSFGFFAALYLLPRKNKNIIFYSRDNATLFYLCLFGFNPVAEIHDYRSKKPKWAVNYILKKSRKIIANSSGTLELIRDHYPNISTDKFLVVPNGVDLEFFDIKDSKETAREKLGISQNKKIIAYIGSLEVVGTGKGVEDLIRAFEFIENYHTNVELYIVGGPDGLVSKYQKITHSGAVKFTGRVDYKKIPLYLRAIDVVVIPLPEGRHSITTSPIKLFEYMAAGKPIIASDLPSLCHYLKEKNAIFFKPGDHKDMAEKIKLILENPHLADNLSRQAREDSKRYSWINRADRVINFISGIRICYFGDFNPNYARNRVIIRGLKENGVEVLLCHTNLKGLRGLIDLFKKHRSLKNKYDILIVGYSDSRFITPLARLLTRKPVVWDAFYSLYDSWVFDRKLISPRSLKAKCYWFLDWLNCRLAAKILLDTDEHIRYFSKTFFVRDARFLRVFVGTDDKVFYPRERDENNKNFTVHFHGKFIPLQGVEYIIRAAGILREKEVYFQIIGKGQEYKRIRGLAKELMLDNINWIDEVSYESLPSYLNGADIVLGVFGNTAKVGRIIPNKVYEAAATRRPIITADTPAIRELFKDGDNILLCRPADPEDLAEKILELKNDAALRGRIAKNGYELYKSKGTPDIIGRNLLEFLK